MKSQQILKTYHDFMESKGHKVIPNVPVVPDNDPTLLFVNSGMFPLVPYLSGEKHPLGSRLTNVQRSLRFEDIEEVGNTNRHTVLFHMIGNWSLGDYFKEEQLNWIYEFFVEKIGLDINRIYATVFEGDESAPKDTPSINILKTIFKKYGIEAEEGTRIFPYGKEDNWWKRGDAPGELGGPDSETFYYLGEGTGEGKNPAENQDEFLEIGNSVFMQYRKTVDGGWEELPQKNVDFGGGLERMALVAQKKRDIFETDNFFPIIETIEKLTGKTYDSDVKTRKAMRVLTDHIRASTILVMDGVLPSNKDQGYILRRLIRRMARYARIFEIETALAPKLVTPVVEIFDWLYPELKDKRAEIEQIVTEEENKFHKTLKNAEKHVKKILDTTSGNEKDLAHAAFDLFQSSGYPFEIFIEDVEHHGIPADVDTMSKEYEKLFDKHRAQSRSGAEKRFKGGLADNEQQTIQYHTATHLLHQALNDTLGGEIRQEGSNITSERLRFDFFSSTRPTQEDKEKVQEIVNKKIQESLPVSYKMMAKTEADKIGAKAFFKEKYPDTVKVYVIGGAEKKPYSVELCGGPHVSNTQEIGSLELYKLEKTGTNMYRIYAR